MRLLTCVGLSQRRAWWLLGPTRPVTDSPTGARAATAATDLWLRREVVLASQTFRLQLDTTPCKQLPSIATLCSMVSAHFTVGLNFGSLLQSTCLHSTLLSVPSIARARRGLIFWRCSL